MLCETLLMVIRMGSALKAIELAALSVIGVRAEEQAPYSVFDRTGPFEVRTYGARFAAEVTVPAASENQARGGDTEQARIPKSRLLKERCRAPLL